MIQSPTESQRPEHEERRSSVEPRGYAHLWTYEREARKAAMPPMQGAKGSSMDGLQQFGSKMGMKGVQCGHQARAAPTVSAIFAPRAPIGLGAPVVVSRAVWCSISAFSSAPSRITMAEIQSHVMKPIAAPSEP